MLTCVLWDFGDTLVDERWMHVSPPTIPHWGSAWREYVTGELADRWNRGDIGSADVFAELARRTSSSVEEVRRHADACCAHLDFFEAPWRSVRACALPQAIVTINPDLFSDAVVPAHRLDRVFAAIVASWQARTLDKTALCALALERLGADRAGALLIDNRPENVAAWVAAGGRGYTFRGDAQFVRDLDGELAELAAAARGAT